MQLSRGSLMQPSSCCIWHTLIQRQTMDAVQKPQTAMHTQNLQQWPTFQCSGLSFFSLSLKTSLQEFFLRPDLPLSADLQSRFFFLPWFKNTRQCEQRDALLWLEAAASAERSLCGRRRMIRHSVQAGNTQISNLNAIKHKHVWTPKRLIVLNVNNAQNYPHYAQNTNEAPLAPLPDTAHVQNYTFNSSGLSHPVFIKYSLHKEEVRSPADCFTLT